MDRYFLYLNSGNALDSVTRSISEGIFSRAEERECPYLVEVRGGIESDQMCAGVFAMLWYEEVQAKLRKEGLPAVNLSNSSGPLADFGNALSDDLAVGRMAAEHLLSRGYRQFLGVGTNTTQYSEDRLAGFVSALATKGHQCLTREVNPHMGKGRWNPTSYQEHVWAQIGKEVTDLPMDTGIFVVCDWLAWPLLRSIERHLPERLSTLGLLGVDNLHGGRFDPRKAMMLSSIIPGFRGVGRKALDLMMDHVFEGAPLAGIVHRCPPEGVAERASTAGPACADPLLAKMIRDMWENIRKQKPVVLGDLIRRNGMSSSTFEKKFRSKMNKSARELLTEMRIDYARELIRSNEHPITEIGYLCGYANPSAFSNAFKNQVGLSPRGWKELDHPNF